MQPRGRRPPTGFPRFRGPGRLLLRRSSTRMYDESPPGFAPGFPVSVDAGRRCGSRRVERGPSAGLLEDETSTRRSARRPGFRFSSDRPGVWGCDPKSLKNQAIPEARSDLSTLLAGRPGSASRHPTAGLTERHLESVGRAWRSRSRRPETCADRARVIGVGTGISALITSMRTIGKLAGGKSSLPDVPEVAHATGQGEQDRRRGLLGTHDAANAAACELFPFLHSARREDAPRVIRVEQSASTID